MSKLSDAVELFRSQVLSREHASLATLGQTYLDLYSRISFQLADLQKAVLQNTSSGKEVSVSSLAKDDRLKSLLNQLSGEMTRFVAFANQHISEQQMIAVSDAQVHSAELITLAQGRTPNGTQIPSNFSRFNPRTIPEIVGKLSEGSPLRELLDQIAPEAVSRARKAITESLVAGDNPKATARNLRAELNIPLTRALTIARTEVLGAYRNANLETYKANDDVVKGWEWSCEFSLRTCAMCIAMSGSFHPLDEPFGSHPNCRCSPVPVTKTWEELGFTGIPDSRPVLETGPEWFSRQPDSTQREILGPGKYELYKSGELKLSELVGYRDDPKWGPTRWERSLKDLREVADNS